ncbi:AraC family transcriptional regulator [Pontixanthobacter luteolus]|uniref:AraC family transcriptional regulator n=1 Tax=Pontixanthobacter luteolus TaxID=295089 RepID=UPI0023046A1B|nr:helix-turn-helix domain-containing protein [Pontixanthobacter luteolus]
MSGQCRIAVSFHEPPPDLERYFTTFYHVDIDPGPSETVSDSLHPEWANFRVFSGARPHNEIAGNVLDDCDVTVTGPSRSPLNFTMGATSIWGIGLMPLGWSTFVGRPADDFANTINDARISPAFTQFAELADGLQSREGAEHSQLDWITHYFREAAPRFGKEDPRITAIHTKLVEPELPHVSDLADQCGLNQRTLERLCRKHFGFSPKLLLRRQRFMRSLAQFMLDPTLGWIGAIDSLYFDQSHFVRDCKEFLGMTPTEYAEMDHPVMGAFLKERMRAYGSAVPTLDPPERAPD